MTNSSASSPSIAQNPASGSEHGETPIAICGVPLDRVTLSGTLDRVDAMIRSGKPHYVATANVDFLVQARQDIELLRILLEADLVLCDGTPLVWASRWLGNPLPERVAGSDLVPELLREAGKRNYRLFLLGGTEESAGAAARAVEQKYNVRLAGWYSPPFRPLLEMDHDEIRRRVQESGANILLVAFGCPKQEKWINMQYRSLNVPMAVGVGATVDFLAGHVTRAPRWMQRAGLEWVFRLLQEPRRLVKRYAVDLWVFGRGIAHQVRMYRPRKREGPIAPVLWKIQGDSPAVGSLCLPKVMDRDTVLDAAALEREMLEHPCPVLVDGSHVERLDSTALGWLAHLSHACWRSKRPMVFFGSAYLKNALGFMGWLDAFSWCADEAAAREQLRSRLAELNVQSGGGITVWQGEITAANVDTFWKATEPGLERLEAGAVLIVDISGVRFLDSAAVGMMIRLRKAAGARQAEVRFRKPTSAVLNVLQKLRLDKVLVEDTQ